MKATRSPGGQRPRGDLGPAVADHEHEEGHHHEGHDRAYQGHRGAFAHAEGAEPPYRGLARLEFPLLGVGGFHEPYLREDAGQDAREGGVLVHGLSGQLGHEPADGHEDQGGDRQGRRG